MPDEPKVKTSVTDQITPIIWYDAAMLTKLAGAIITLIALLLSIFGVDDALFSEKASKAIEPILTVLALVLGIWAARDRAVKPTPPVAFTQAGVSKLEQQMHAPPGV